MARCHWRRSTLHESPARNNQELSLTTMPTPERKQPCVLSDALVPHEIFRLVPLIVAMAPPFMEDAQRMDNHSPPGLHFLRRTQW